MGEAPAPAPRVPIEPAKQKRRDDWPDVITNETHFAIVTGALIADHEQYRYLGFDIERNLMFRRAVGEAGSQLDVIREDEGQRHVARIYSTLDKCPEAAPILAVARGIKVF